MKLRSNRFYVVTAISSATAGVSFYVSSRNVVVALAAMALTLVFFGVIAAAVDQFIRSRGGESGGDHDATKKSRPLLTLIFVLAISGQIALGANAPDVVLYSFVIAIVVVALAEYVIRTKRDS